MGTNNMQHNSVPDKRVYRVEEIANLLGISTSSAYELVKKGHFNRNSNSHIQKIL